MPSLFIDYVEPGKNEDLEEGYPVLRTDILGRLRVGPVQTINDLDAALDLLQLTQSELTKRATDGKTVLSELEIEVAIRTLRVVLARMGIPLSLPFRNFATFVDYWIAQGMSGGGSWRLRRQYLETVFVPVRDALQGLQDNRLTKPLTNPVDVPVLNWPMVDEEIRELRRNFESAVTPQNFRALGTHCIGVLEAVGDQVFNASEHLTEEDDPSEFVKDRFKNRIIRYVQHKLQGSENDEIISAVKAVAALAHKLKHGEISTAVAAGLAEDTTIFLANMIRRISDPSLETHLNDEAPF